LEQFHGEKQTAIDSFDFVDGADVGMVKGRGRTSFGTKAPHPVGVTGEFLGTKLERDTASELDVFGR
jgi:hypothetical protein